MNDKSCVGMDLCFLCGEPKGIMLDKRMKNTLPRAAVYSYEPCDKCKGYMQQGIILIHVKDGSDPKNPERLGDWVVMTEDFIRLALEPAMADLALKTRVLFVPDEAWKMLGLDEISEGG